MNIKKLCFFALIAIGVSAHADIKDHLTPVVIEGNQKIKILSNDAGVKEYLSNMAYFSPGGYYFSDTRLGHRDRANTFKQLLLLSSSESDSVIPEISASIGAAGISPVLNLPRCIFKIIPQKTPEGTLIEKIEANIASYNQEKRKYETRKENSTEIFLSFYKTNADGSEQDVKRRLKLTCDASITTGKNTKEEQTPHLTFIIEDLGML